MYKIEKTRFGFKLTFEGYIKGDEMQAWLNESEKMLRDAPEKFKVFADMRALLPLPSDAQTLMKEGQQLYKKNGMTHSLSIVKNPVTHMQFTRFARESDVHNMRTYLDASRHTIWEKFGVDELTQAMEAHA